ncbi:hypothetical protein ACRRTK_013606 [Alexandromys fortis]
MSPAAYLQQRAATEVTLQVLLTLRHPSRISAEEVMRASLSESQKATYCLVPPRWQLSRNECSSRASQ